MGTTLSLYVDDNSIESPYLSRGFKDEIIFEWYIKHRDYLSEAEIRLLTPNPLGETVTGEKKASSEQDNDTLLALMANAISGKGSLADVDKLFDEFLVISNELADRGRDPVQLKNVLKKVQDYLEQQADRLPLVHAVYADHACTDELEYITIDGIKALPDGDLYYLDNYSEIRNKLQIKSFYEDHGKIDLMVDATPVLQLGERTYYTTTISKAQQFSSEFTNCYELLDEAIRLDKRVLWEFG
jgi:hypothetical protein